MLKVLSYMCLILLLILSMIFIISILTEWIYAVLNRRKEKKYNDYEILKGMDIKTIEKFLREQKLKKVL